MIQDSMLAETRLFKPVAVVTVPARTEPFSAAAFYQSDDTGLWVEEDFLARFDLHEMGVDCAPERPYVASLVKQEYCTQEELYAETVSLITPEARLSTLQDIAALLKAQPAGENGFLITNSYWNFFFVEGKNHTIVVVRAKWSEGENKEYAEWLVTSWEEITVGEFRDLEFEGGDQVVCPGYATL